MGGRGNFSQEKQALETYIFSTVGSIRSFEGDKDVKVILQNDIGRSVPTPTFCNTADTMYVSIAPLRDRNQGNAIVGYIADHIYYYKGHYLHKSVDLAERGGAHYHYWTYRDGSVLRKSHDKNNTFSDLTLEDLYYKEQCSIFVANFRNK